jgi:ribonuclease E
MRLLMPSHAKKVQFYADAVPLFQRFGVEDQLAAMYQPLVQLKSGGYLVINPTEALVSIDINSGRSTREHNIEQTATATNLEAAHEIARQLRLRDMAGLVVIDFIDMENNSNIRKVEKAMKEALKNDRARIQVGRISSFGLFEMSRQRIRTGVLEASTRQCPHCEGTGLVRTASSAGLSALRMLEDEAARGRGSQLLLRASQEAALYVLNRKRAELAEIEDRYGVLIEILSDGTLEGARMTVEAGGPPPTHAPRLPTPMAIEPDDFDDTVEEEEEIEAEVEEDSEEGIESAKPGETAEEAGEREGRNRRRRRRRRGRGRDRETNGETAGEESGEAPAEAGEAHAETGEAPAEEDGEGRRRRGRRGRRSGRRRGGENAGGEQPNVEGEAEAEAGAETETVAAEPVEAVAEPVEAAPKGRRRPRARKADAAPAAAPPVEAFVETPVAEEPAVAEVSAAEEPVAKPRRGRRKKADIEAEAAVSVAEPVVEAPAPVVAAEPEAPAKPKRRARAKAATTSDVEASIDAPVADGPEPEPAAEADEAGAPRRGGWWQRTFGA